MIYEIRFTKEAKKDVAKLSPKLKQKLKKIIQEQITDNPYEGKKLVGDLTGFFFMGEGWALPTLIAMDRK